MEAFATLLPMTLFDTLAASPVGLVLSVLLLTGLTTILVTLSVPGTMAPVSFVSGAVLGVGGILVVVAGALIGTHLLFLASRHFMADRLARRWGARIEAMRGHLERRGPAYVVGARLGGVPHVVVSAACAASPLTARQFLAASLLGMLPAITIAALAGTSLTVIA